MWRNEPFARTMLPKARKLLPRGGKEVRRKAALWYTAKPTNDMRPETTTAVRCTTAKPVCANPPTVLTHVEFHLTHQLRVIFLLRKQFVNAVHIE